MLYNQEKKGTRGDVVGLFRCRCACVVREKVKKKAKTLVFCSVVGFEKQKTGYGLCCSTRHNASKLFFEGSHGHCEDVSTLKLPIMM